jgi:hypothetical protein
MIGLAAFFFQAPCFFLISFVFLTLGAHEPIRFPAFFIQASLSNLQSSLSANLFHFFYRQFLLLLL